MIFHLESNWIITERERTRHLNQPHLVLVPFSNLYQFPISEVIFEPFAMSSVSLLAMLFLLGVLAPRDIAVLIVYVQVHVFTACRRERKVAGLWLKASVTGNSSSSPGPFFFLILFSLLASCQLISPARSGWAGGFSHLNDLVENRARAHTYAPQSCGHHLEDALPCAHKVKMGQCA